MTFYTGSEIAPDHKREIGSLSLQAYVRRLNHRPVRVNQRCQGCVYFRDIRAGFDAIAGLAAGEIENVTQEFQPSGRSWAFDSK